MELIVVIYLGGCSCSAARLPALQGHSFLHLLVTRAGLGQNKTAAGIFGRDGGRDSVRHRPCMKTTVL